MRFFLALLFLVSPIGAASAQDAPFVPNFWDTRATIARPDTQGLGTIRFITSDDFPPFNYRDRRGVLIGFNVDLARAVCEVLATPCTIQSRPFADLATALKQGEGDAVIAGLSPVGLEGYAATRPYLKIPARFVAKAGGGFDPLSPPEGAFVGVACNSAHEAYLAAFFPALSRACYADVNVALEQLKAGAIDAVFGDALRLASFTHSAEAEACCAFAGGPYLSDTYFGPGLVVVTRAEDEPLRQALDYALREVYRNTRYEELYLRYFPISLF